MAVKDLGLSLAVCQDLCLLNRMPTELSQIFLTRAFQFRKNAATEFDALEFSQLLADEGVTGISSKEVQRMKGAVTIFLKAIDGQK